LNKLSKNKVFHNKIIILTTTIKKGRAKYDKIIDKEGFKDGKIIEGINKMEMNNLARMGI